MSSSDSLRAASSGNQLPVWLTERVDYEPSQDRDSFIRSSVLQLMSMLQVFRTPACPEGVVDAALSKTSPALRLVGLLVCLICVSAATNMAFVWLAFAAVLVVLASKPPRRLAAVLKPACVVAVVALIINLPAALFGAPAAPARMALKSFITSALVLNLANAVQTERLFGALRVLHVPSQIIFMLNLALRDVIMLGQVASRLAEALALRSVGRNRDKAASTAGVLGTTFIRANELATLQADSLTCRGFTGEYPREETCVSHVWNVVYALLIAAIVGVFFYLEGALA